MGVVDITSPQRNVSHPILQFGALASCDDESYVISYCFYYPKFRGNLQFIWVSPGITKNEEVLPPKVVKVFRVHNLLLPVNNLNTLKPSNQVLIKTL